MPSQTNHERVLKELRKIFAENFNKRICVVGASCVGKSALVRDLPECLDVDEIIWGSLTPDIQEQLRVYEHSPWDDEKAKIWNAHANFHKIKIKPGQPIFAADILDCDLLVYLEIDEETYASRSAKRRKSLEHVLQHKAEVEEAVKRSAIPIIVVDLSSSTNDSGSPMATTKALSRLKAIIFDADDTLVDHKECERQALEFLFSRIGMPFKSEYQDVFRPLDESLWESVVFGTNKIAKEKIPTHRFQILFARLGINFTDYAKANEFFMEGLANSCALLDGAREVVAQLYNDGYKIAVATNGLVKLQKPRVMNTTIAKYVSEIVVSEEVDAPKPDPKIFQTILERLDIKPSEAIMIGDSLRKDVQGAQNAEIKGVWYNPEKEINKTTITPDFEIHSLHEIATLIKNNLK